jgi:hypothetical protein
MLLVYNSFRTDPLTHIRQQAVKYGEMVSVAKFMENLTILNCRKTGYLAVTARNTTFRAAKQMACSTTTIF